jgi:hypothetical protein
MKTSALDFVLVGAMITLLAGLSLGGVAWVLHPLITVHAGAYFVIADFFGFLLLYGILSGLTVQLLLKLRPLQTGEYAMDSPNFTYWKLLVMLCDFGRGALLPFTPMALRPVVAQLYGGKFGSNVALSGMLFDPFMVQLGSDVTIGSEAEICGNVTHQGRISFGRVSIGNGVTIGMKAIIFPDVEIGDNAAVALNSVVMQGSRIPAGETWRGNPARKWREVVPATSAVAPTLTP